MLTTQEEEFWDHAAAFLQTLTPSDRLRLRNLLDGLPKDAGQQELPAAPPRVSPFEVPRNQIVC